MAAKPVDVHYFKIPASILPKDHQWASLDRGCTLTKLLFLEKDVYKENAETYRFTCALFLNRDFESSLDFMAEKAHIEPTRGKMNVTGAGGASFRQIISEKLKVEVEFQDEFMSQCLGAITMLKHMDKSEILFPQPAKAAMPEGTEMPKAITKGMEKMAEEYEKMGLTQKDKEGQEASPFPALFGFLGSGGGFVRIEDGAPFKLVGGLALAGKSFMGLAKCLLGTNNYDEITALAEKGDRTNVDTQVKDVIKDFEHSTYGNLPPDLPIFAFGKAYDLNLGLSDFKKEDLAASLISLTAFNICLSVTIACAAEKVTKMYLGGNMVKSEIFRREIAFGLQFFGKGLFEIEYMNSGHSGALGAMLTNREEYEAFIKG